MNLWVTSLFICSAKLVLASRHALDTADSNWGEKVSFTGTARDRLAFSWDTVPIFQQLCNPNATLSSAFNQSRLAFLTRNFPLITIEHCQGFYNYKPGESIEDYFLAAARQLKEYNSSVTVLFYTNSISALPYYRWCSAALNAHPEWRMKNEQGELCHSGGGHMLPQVHGYCWDQRQEDVRNYWASLCANLTKLENSSLDGCYIDKAGDCLSGENKRRLQSDLKEAFALAQTDTGSDFIVGGLDADAASGLQLSQVYTFGPSLASLQWLNNTRTAGMVAEAHAQTNNDGSREDHLNASLATFLIGAYEKSYFAFSTNPGAGYHPFCDGTAPTWCYGMGWSELYTKPLGKPVADATVSENGQHFERHFTSGTHVMLDLQKHSCEINWADGTQTICREF